MATATYGVGVYGTDSYDEIVYPTVLPTGREKPPLRVTMDIETPAGKHYRWAEDEPAPENVPSGLRWSDTMPGGFESLDCTLPRKPGIDYSDLEQLSTIRVLGASGDVAGEYRLERSPRTSGDEVSISPGAVGWQAHLEDDKSVREIYVDRDLSKWGGVSVTRRLALSTSNFPVHSEASTGVDAAGMSAAVILQMTQTLNVGSRRVMSVGLYNALGVSIGSIYFDVGTWDTLNLTTLTGGVWIADMVLGDDDSLAGSLDVSGNLAPSTAGTLSATTSTRTAAEIRLYLNAVDNTTGNWEAYYRKLAVFGNHGLTKRGTAPDQGFYASDVVRHAVSRFAPSLHVTGESVQQSGFVIPHLEFLEPTTVGEIVRQATRFGLQDWAVWQDKTFWWHERGAFAKLWRSRVAPAQLDETGPQVDRLWESIIVQYQDVDGTTRTVGPPGSGADTEDASLKDSDPDNPANQLGITRRDLLQMGTSTSAGAIEVGRRFLEESKILDRSGRARIVGHVEDSSGVIYPYWRPRAGDYISFIDAADTSYRRIVKTDKSHSDRTCGLDLDAPPEGLKALLERLGVVLVPLGLS